MRLGWIIRNAGTILRRQSTNWQYKIVEINEFDSDERLLGPYYCSLAHKLTNPGVAQSLSMYAAETNGDTLSFYHPTLQGHIALAYYEKLIETGDTSWEDKFTAKASELMEAGSRKPDGSLVWPYPPSLARVQRRPWLSAMGQGHAIAVLSRAYQLTGEQAFADSAYQAFVPFKNSVAEGGVVADDQHNGVFFEEYAYDGAQHQNHTLNGMLTALMCLHDLSTVTGNTEVMQYFESGLATVRNRLGDYDFPFCSSYDLRHLVGNAVPAFYAHYNAVHVAQLKVLGRMTGDTFFEGIGGCWDRKLMDRVNRRRLMRAYFRRRVAELFFH